ncbi:MAG: hypothetical protein PUE13_04285, partial [Clostridiales bacterium]|nr:hypothetical protein [Clostridiales bacterium]
TVICDIDDGGYKGNSDMLLFYYYLLLDTDNGFVILDSIYDGNEHYEGSKQSVLRLSDVLDLVYFKNAGYDVPYYMICPTGRYSYSSYPSDTNYYFITDQYKIVKYSQSNDKNTPYTPAVKDNRLYGARKTYLSGSSTYVYNVQELAIKDSIVILQNTQSISTTVFEEEYTSYGESYASNIENKTFYTLPCVENMYAHINTTTQINSSGITEYYDVISLYKNVNYDMVKIKEEIFPGSITSKLTDIYGITGLDEDKYTQKGCSMPVARTGNYFILKDGTIVKISLDSNIYTSYNYGTRDGVLTVVRNKNKNSYIYHSDSSSGNTYYWHMVNDIYFDKNGNTILGDDTEYRSDGSSHGLDGYYINYSSFSNSKNITQLGVSQVKDWYTKYLTNVFPDGRYAEAEWVDINESQYELWYIIYNPDGSVNSRGPTGTVITGQKIYNSRPICIAANNSKMVISIELLIKGWMREMYRSSVSEINTKGEYIPGGSIGEKNLIPPDESDTEPVESSIDFNEDDLPIGFNIKDNVIGSGKLEAELRETINAIKLNDITILTDSEFDSGTQNTGTRLDGFSKHDRIGDGYIYVYTNGQNMNWYCTDTESLTPGTYNRSYTAGEKTLYVTVNVIEQPTADGKVSVVF